MIEVNNIVKRYGDILAVDSVSFEVTEGEAFGLLGPNGAGKSTTMNILSLVLEPDSGNIGFGGERHSRHVKRQLGCAPQALALYEELTGRENAHFFGSLYGLAGSKLKSGVDSSLEFVGLSDRANDRVKTYSGGMKRRLNLACALVHEPKVLLLDEPTVGVDPQSRNMIFDRIEALQKQGVTILYTTHYMEEAERLCDRVAIIDNGKILAMDTVDNLITQFGGDSLLLLELSRPPDGQIEIPGIVEGSKVRIQTANPIGTLNELAAKGLQFSSLKIERADLETVFLNLTGRSLRD